MSDHAVAKALEISDALAAVPGVRHTRQLFGPVEPPCTVLAIPELTLVGISPAPSEAAWRVALVVAADDRVENILALIGPVIAALEGVVDVAVRSPVRPGTYPSGSTTLPAYLIDLEVSL